MRANHPDEERLVTVAKFDNQGQLAVAKSLLEASDIEYFVQNEHINRIGGPASPALGVHGAELQVRQADAEDAVAILNSEIDDQDSGNEGSGA